MSTQLDERTEIIPETTEAEAAHIVKTEPGESAVAKVTEARIFGTAVEALCGHVFIPQKDPGRLPLCQKCKEIYQMYKDVNGLNETPNQ